METTDLNDLFNEYPEYDVFNDKSDIGKKRKPKQVDYIQYDENNDFRNNTNYRTEAVSEPLQQEIEEEHHTDYNDDFGVYKVYEKRKHNILTLLFFPVSLLWLEITLRLCCRQPVLNFSLAYVIIFSFAFSGFFTLICTFADSKFNRRMAKVLLLLLTFVYAIQGIYFNSTNIMFSFSSFSPISSQQFADGITKSGVYLLLMFVPFVLSLLFCRFIFPFRHIFVAGKIFLAISVIILHILGVGLIAFDNLHLPRSDKIYYTQSQVSQTQERFGLLTAQRIDITNTLKNK